MRVLAEIVEDIVNGKMPSHEECFYAMRVYRDMFNLEHRQLRNELIAEHRTAELIRKLQAENSFKMYTGALKVSPKQWLGEELEREK